jgi:ElaB/YqjD/DUF883 family membrane-anchored ribosome-binding protein
MLRYLSLGLVIGFLSVGNAFAHSPEEVAARCADSVEQVVLRATNAAKDETHECVRRINALQDQGRHEAAAALARECIANATQRTENAVRYVPYYMRPIAVGLVVAIVLFVMSLASQRSLPKPQSPIPVPSDFVVDPPPPSIIVPDALPPEPDSEPPEMPQIVIDPPREKEAVPLIVEAPEPPRRPLVPEVERPELPQSLKWDRVSGIVATQVEGSDSWYAVHADATTSTSNAGDYQVFRSLGNSWAEARTESGIRVVLGPNAVAKVAISVGDAPKVKLQIERGKVGIGDLPASTQVVVARDAEQSEWLVSNSETELAFDAQQVGSGLQLVQGEIRSDGNTFNGPAIVSFNDGGWVAGRLTRREPWLAGPPALSPIERQIAIIAKEEGDLVAGLLANRPSMNEFQAHAAAVWGLSLDPVRTIPLALASPIAGQRAAAAQWFVDPANDAIALRRVLPGLRPLLQGSQCNVPRWISVYRGESPLSQSLAQNMLLGLQPNEPLFVREMALTSLMQMSGQSFPSYDVRNPTRQTITQITRSLQPWINQLP